MKWNGNTPAEAARGGARLAPPFATHNRGELPGALVYLCPDERGAHVRADRDLRRVFRMVRRSFRARRLLRDRYQRAGRADHVRPVPALGRALDLRGSGADAGAPPGGTGALPLPAGARRRTWLLLEISMARPAQGLDRDHHGLDRVRPRESQCKP